MSSAVWIGTSGFVYRHWRKGVFYPARLPQNRELEYYAEHFRTVELNNPFYRLPQKETFVAWRKRTPPDFLFAVKASRYLTHIKKLKDAEEPLALFMDRARGLGPKLGPILFQFPATWKRDLDRLESFLKILPKRREFAFEFRHPAWLEDPVFALLRRHRAALCIPVKPERPRPEVAVTADFSYIRLHAGSGESGGFTPAELAYWAGQVRALRRRGLRVYLYFNNDSAGCAIRNAFSLRKLLGVAR